jgi:hypothetical protein
VYRLWPLGLNLRERRSCQKQTGSDCCETKIHVVFSWGPASKPSNFMVTEVASRVTFARCNRSAAGN